MCYHHIDLFSGDAVNLTILELRVAIVSISVGKILYD